MKLARFVKHSVSTSWQVVTPQLMRKAVMRPNMGVTVIRPARLSALMVVVVLGCTPESVPSPVSGWDRPFAGALPGTRSRTMTSETTGRTYEISVALPRNYHTSGDSYPVLYGVDAFGTVVEAARLLRLDKLIPELLIVGVGFTVSSFFDASKPRAVDLTPTQDQDWEIEQAEESPESPAPEGSGGAPEFLQFLRQELIPSIDAEFRTNPLDRALFGHSFGGLFAIHALLNGEGTFQRFIAGSPSLWWDDDVTFRHEEAFAAAHAELPARVFFAVGELEEQDPDLYWGHMVSDLQRFVEAVKGRQYNGLEFELHVFEDESHESVIPATISRGLLYIYQD